MERNFSQRVRNVLGYSREEAERLHTPIIGPEHLLLGILRDGTGKAVEALRYLGIQPERLKTAVEELLLSHPCDTPAEASPSQETAVAKSTDKILKMSLLESRLLKNPITDTEHLLLAILRDPSSIACQALNAQEISYQSVLDYVKTGTSRPADSYDNQADSVTPSMGPEFADEDDDEVENDGPFSKKKENKTSTMQAKDSGSNTPVLDNFGIDMTKAAEENRLDPVVGREKEIERLAQILSRRKKNNPVLIGDPGVGKSAIVEGLALRIVQRKVSRVLFDKRVVSLDMASIVNPNIILFIDEIHTIVGAGGATGTLDAANMLKPALARGEIQCVGATTLDEYRKSIEKDGALERRFQKIMVAPTSPDETLQILKNIKERYEDHHNVTYTPEALEACVKLTERYISDRNFPDKAIDALDEAGSRVHIAHIVVPRQRENRGREISELRAGRQFQGQGEIVDERARRGKTSLGGVVTRTTRSCRRRRNRRDSGLDVGRSRTTCRRVGKQKAPGDGQRTQKHHHRARLGRRQNCKSHTPQQGRAERPQPTHRHLHVLRPDRCRKNLFGQETGRIPVRLARCPHTG